MLSAADRTIALAFKRQIDKVSLVRDLRVYGSRARGDATLESDMDIYVEVDTITPETRTKISEIAWKLSLEMGLVISTLVVTRDQLEWGPIGANPIMRCIMQEGVSV